MTKALHIQAENPQAFRCPAIFIFQGIACFKQTFLPLCTDLWISQQNKKAFSSEWLSSLPFKNDVFLVHLM